jgi:uncharacterized protein YtpQ (UPF0354 family)
MHRLVVTAVVLTLTVCTVAKAETMSADAFTKHFARALEAAVPTKGVVVVGPLQLQVYNVAGGTSGINLSNTYREYTGSPERLNELVELFANAVRNPIPPKLDRSRIVPMIKDRAWLANIQPLFRSHGDDALFDPLNSQLIIAYVEDNETRARYLNSRDDVGDRSALRRLALRNLARILPKIEMRQYGEVFLISAGGNYEPSLMLFDELWSTGQIKVDGDIVVAIPARDILLVTGSNSPGGLAEMRKMAAKALEGPQGLTDALFVYRGGEFVELNRP